jgi:diaminopimelate decarboxylase
MGFEYVDNELFAEKVKVEEIVKKFKTPLYIYSKNHFIEQFNKFKNAFKREHLVCFAIKANSNLSVINTFANLDSGADIVSKGELFRALKAGINPKKIVFSGVAKTKDEIQYAINNDILMINLESLDELYAVNDAAEEINKKARIAFRVNPDVDPKTHPYISTGLKKNKFGIPYEEAFSAYIKAKELKNIEIYGVQFHIGSQLLDSTPIYDASVKIAELMRKLKDQGINIQAVDVGGGLGIVYDKKTDNPPPVDVYANQLEEAFKEFPDVLLVLEPGRFLVGNGGIMVTQVVYHKTNGKKSFIIVDAGMNDLIRPSLYGAYQEVEPIKLGNSKKIVCDIVGPICETGDFLARDYEIEDVQNGEYLAVFSSGAYGFTMSSNYNSRPRAAEVLVDGADYKLIRQRESLEDLIKGETL